MTDQGQTNVQESPVRGAVIRQLRDAMNDGSGMARHKFAAAADISPSTLQRAEDSEPGTNISTLTRIAKVLGVPLSTIYDNDALANMDAIPSGDVPVWFTQFAEQMDARLTVIENQQAEILRNVRK